MSLRIIVLGHVVRSPVGGMVWSNLHYLMGLTRLGHDIYYVEDSDDYPSCYNPELGIVGIDPQYGLRFASQVLARIGLGERWAYHDAHTARWFGPCGRRIVAICKGSDLLLNLACMNPLRPWLLEIPARALVDEDPAFTQINNLKDPVARQRALRHTAFLSFGENIGTDRSAIPDDGLPWQGTRQPVVLEALPMTPGSVRGNFTTVMQWHSYKAKKYRGVRYGMKSDSFAPFLDLPARTRSIFELAIPNSSGQALLRSKGWFVRDPSEMTRYPWTYEDYIRQSKAEFGVAKHGYVVSRSGWFSERSITYLASGRPVLVQETGFSDCLPTGAGVIPFSTLDEALVGIDEINGRYDNHCRAAREVAQTYFDSRKILPRLIEYALEPVRLVDRHKAASRGPGTRHARDDGI